MTFDVRGTDNTSSVDMSRRFGQPARFIYMPCRVLKVVKREGARLSTSAFGRTAKQEAKPVQARSQMAQKEVWHVYEGVEWGNRRYLSVSETKAEHRRPLPANERYAHVSSPPRQSGWITGVNRFQTPTHLSTGGVSPLALYIAARAPGYTFLPPSLASNNLYTNGVLTPSMTRL